MFKTGPKGDVFPIFFVHQNKQLKEYGINAIIFDDIEYVNNYLTIGTKAEIIFDSSLRPSINRIIKRGKTHVELPTNCQTCDRKLNVRNDVRGLNCKNPFCPAHSRGFLYKLLKLVTEEHGVKSRVPTEVITEFLDLYPYQGSPSFVQDLKEFELLFKKIKDKNTQSREKDWQKVSPDHWERLWGIELRLQEFLNAHTHYLCSIFWSTCNFPGITEDVFYNLCQISPSKILEGPKEEAKREMSVLCPAAKKFVNVNYHFLVSLNNFFNNCRLLRDDKITWVAVHSKNQSNI